MGCVPYQSKEKEIEGLPCFPSVTKIPVDVDLVSLYLPASISITLIEEFKQKGIKKVYINPGADSQELIASLKAANIEPLMICSITAIGKSPLDY